MTNPDFTPVEGCVVFVSRFEVVINFGSGPVHVPWDCIKQQDAVVGDIRTWDVHTWLMIREGVIC